MNQDPRKLEAVICQLLATVSVEKEARRKALREPVGPSLDERLFPSRDEMIKSYMFAALDLDVELPNLSLAAAKLPRPYGDMLCYLAYKDLHERMRAYQRLAEELAQQDEIMATVEEPDALAVPA